MSLAPSVNFDDLESALHWVSSAGPFENSAFISKKTGQIYFTSITYDTDDELPEDIEDTASYLSVPHRNDLDLGRSLALNFVEGYVPEDLGTVQGYFHRRGAYGRFKDLMERRGALEKWYEYERQATKTALLIWANEHTLTVTYAAPPTEA